MHHFAYVGGVLHAEDVAVPTIADAVGTPFYCYATATMERHYRVLEAAFAGLDPLICFAVKANSNQAVLKTLANLGAGMDVVSEGELRRARAAGVPPEKIIFAGVGKTRDEMAYALQEGIFGFNVESTAELESLSSVAQGLGGVARVALRINPDVDARTHAKIATGKSENKFGIPFGDALAVFAHARQMPGIEAHGVHMHIGSQITDLAPFESAFARLRALVVALRSAGHVLDHVDLGGGLGVPYRNEDRVPPHPQAYAEAVRKAVGDLGVRIAIEPGRMIVGNAGILVAHVILIKRGQDRTFTVVDAAMNDLLRPTLYEADHDIWPVIERAPDAPRVSQDIVGPVCETGDYLALGRVLPMLASGDLVAIMTAGAYGAVMSSVYNTRRLVPEVLVRGDAFAVVRPRPSYDDLIGMDRLAPWLT